MKSPDAVFSTREFRDVLGLFPTGVAVVTGYGRDRRPVGITVNSFTSVSLEPPLVSFNAAKTLNSLNHLRDMDSFIVNVLTQDQNAISSSFARASTDKWAGVRVRHGLTGNPVIQPHLAMFECERHAVHSAGDHLIIVGKVLHFETGQKGAAPLVFFHGEYRRLGCSIER